MLQAGERFKLWEVTEDASGTVAQTWPVGGPLGPYKLRSVNPRWYERGIPNADIVSPISFEGVKVDEA